MLQTQLGRSFPGTPSAAPLHRHHAPHTNWAPSPARRHIRASVAERLQAPAELDISHLNGLKVVVNGIDRDASATASTSGHSHAPPTNKARANGHAVHADQLQSTVGAAAAAAAAAPARAEDSSNVGGDKELGAEIKACEVVQDVLDIVQDEAARMSLFTAVQAASKILALSRTAPAKATAAQLAASPAFATLVAQLHAGAPRMSRAQLCNATHALAGLSVPFTPAAARAYQARAKELAGEMNGRDIAMLLRGFAAAKLKPSRELLDLVGFRAKVVLEEGGFDAQGVSMLLHACAALEYKNWLLLGQAAAAAANTLDQFTPQGLANTVWALGRLGFFSHAILEGAVERYVAQPDAFKPQEACNLLSGAALLRFHPQGALTTLVRALTERAARLRPADFAALFHALGTFAVHPGRDMLGKLLRAMEPQLPAFNARELCQCYWGLGLIGEARQPTMAQIGRLLPDKYESNEMDESLLRQAFQGLLCTKLAEAEATEAAAARGEKAVEAAAAVTAASKVKFPPLMLDAMKRAWVASSQHNSIDPNAVAAPVPEPSAQAASSSSGKQHRGKGQHSRKFKAEIAAMVKQLGVRHQLARPTKDGLVSVDIALNPNKDRYVALQIVSEHEHTANTGQFLGPTQFQAQLLEVNGWEVAYIRAKDLKAVAADARAAYVADKLRGIGCRVRSSVGMPVAAPGARGADGASSSRGDKGGLELLMDSVQPARGKARKA